MTRCLCLLFLAATSTATTTLAFSSTTAGNGSINKSDGKQVHCICQVERALYLITQLLITASGLELRLETEGGRKDKRSNAAVDISDAGRKFHDILILLDDPFVAAAAVARQV